MIPRVIHQIWLGPAPLPTSFEPLVESWRRRHPGWAHHLWSEESLPQGLRPEVYERLRSPAERSDILRLELLAAEGGVYVDTDFECLRPLDSLLEDVELFAAEYKGGRINNAILGAEAGHPVIRRGLAELRPLARHGSVDKEGTGPLFVDGLLHGSGATIFERRLFYPTWQERPEAYAFHHMARSWKDGAGYRKSIRLARERLAHAEALQAHTRLGARMRLWRDEVESTAARARAKTERLAGPRLDVAVARLRLGRSHATRVPRVLHHVWLEDGALPEAPAARLASWRLANPGWEQRLWRPEDLPTDLVRREAGDPLRSPAERGELLRLELVLRHGGVAADLGLACRRRLDAAVAEREAFAASSAPGVPDPGLVGGVAGHPAIRRALEAAEPFEWHSYPEGSTGGRALTAALADGLVLLPPRLVAPAGSLAGVAALAARSRGGDTLAERERLRARLTRLEQRLRERGSTVDDD